MKWPSESWYNETEQQLANHDTRVIVTAIKQDTGSVLELPLTLGRLPVDQETYVDPTVPQEYEGEEWTKINSNTVDMISSMTVEGGPETPFQKVTVRISRKKLNNFYPQLSINEQLATGSEDIAVYRIVSGQSTLRVKLYSDEEYVYTVTNTKLSSSTYTITAYCDAQKYRGASLEAYGLDGAQATALGFVTSVLTSAASPYAFDAKHIVQNIGSVGGEHDFAPSDGQICFKGTITVWAALQICALALHARIFFAHGRAFVVDYTRLREYTDGSDLQFRCATCQDDPSHTAGAYPRDKMTAAEMYKWDTQCESMLIYPPSNQCTLWSRVMSDASLGNEGYDTVETQAAVTYSRRDGDSWVTETLYDPSSPGTDRYVEVFGLVTQSIDLTQYMSTAETGYDVQADMAQRIASTILDYRRQPQESITFKVSERRRMYSASQGYDLGWRLTFPLVVFADKIYDSEQDSLLMNRRYVPTAGQTSDEAKLPQKLALSDFTHTYPGYTSEYEFGAAATIDLASSTSQILSKLK